MNNRFKTYAFWVALSSAVVVLVQSLGKLFGFEIESSVVENVIMSICGVLIVLGIVTNNDSGGDDDGGQKPDISSDDESQRNDDEDA